MDEIHEPADRGYVAVMHHDSDSGAGIYRRRDDWAATNHLGAAHWFNRADMNEPARTWAYLTGRYRIAYVGAFVDRQA